MSEGARQMTRKEIRIKDDDIVFCGDSLDNKCNIVNELKQEIERLKKEVENRYKDWLICSNTCDKFETENEEEKALVQQLRKNYLKLLAERKDNIFINHIQEHLKKGQKVVCKICGKTAKEIVDEFRKVQDK